MTILLKMAWLNIWRNKRRAVILLCAMIVGLVGVLLLIGFINSWMDSMITSAVQSYEGHVKIHAAKYHDNPTVENSMKPPADACDMLSRDTRVLAWAERVVICALTSNARHSNTLRVIGIDPGPESRVSIVDEAIRNGAFLADTEPGGILVSRRLAEKFETKPGRKLVIMSQRLDGEIASAAFKITGIFETGNLGFDESTVFVLKTDLQKMLNMEEAITEVTVLLNDIEQCNSVRDELVGVLVGADLAVLTWQDLMPFVVKTIELSNNFMIPFYVIFYLAMAFGILNTLLMAIGERKHEIGVLLAIGMKRSRMVVVIVLESIFLAALASVTGTIIGIAVVDYFGRTGIDFSAFAEGMDYVRIGNVLYPYLEVGSTTVAVLSMFVVAVLFSIYPAYRAASRTPVELLRKVG